MELSCYGFELQHFGIPVVWPLGLRGLLTGLYMHRGTGLAFTWAWLPQNGDLWWLIRRRIKCRLGLLLTPGDG